MNRLLEKKEWRPYFKKVSKRTQNERLELEVINLDLGDQIADEWISLDGFSYDAKKDVLYIHTDQLSHAIEKPEQIMISEEGDNLTQISVRDAEGNVQIANIRPLKKSA